MEAESLISIVVPLYNEGSNVETLVDHLKSIEGQYEVILVDASDQPASRRVLENILQSVVQPSKIRLIVSDNISRAVQMNLGARSSTGNALLFLHCDTRLPGRALDLIGEQISAGSYWGRFRVSLESQGLIYRVIEQMINLRSRFRRIATGDQAIFVTTAVFNQCGGYPEIALMEDIAICKKLNRHCRPGLIKQPVVTSARRWQNRGPMETILLMWKLRLLFWMGMDSQQLASMYGNER